jgi:hypothetical protein
MEETEMKHRIIQKANGKTRRFRSANIGAIAPSLRWKEGNRVRSVVFVLTAAFAPFLAWIAIGNIVGEQGDGTFSLAVVITWQNCLIIVMLAAVLERLNRQ